MNTELITKLHEKRQKLEALKTERAALLLAVTETPKFKGLEETIKTVAAHLDEIDAEIRRQAVADYLADQNKLRGCGVEIKVFKVATILDPERAREWALNNFTPALKLDTKVFEKAAIDGTIPTSLATVTFEPRAQIASDLSEFVEEAV